MSPSGGCMNRECIGTGPIHFRSVMTHIGHCSRSIMEVEGAVEGGGEV